MDIRGTKPIRISRHFVAKPGTPAWLEDSLRYWRSNPAHSLLLRDQQYADYFIYAITTNSALKCRETGLENDLVLPLSIVLCDVSVILSYFQVYEEDEDSHEHAKEVFQAFLAEAPARWDYVPWSFRLKHPRLVDLIERTLEKVEELMQDIHNREHELITLPEPRLKALPSNDLEKLHQAFMGKRPQHKILRIIMRDFAIRNKGWHNSVFRFPDIQELLTREAPLRIPVLEDEPERMRAYLDAHRELDRARLRRIREGNSRSEFLIASLDFTWIMYSNPRFRAFSGKPIPFRRLCH